MIIEVFEYSETPPIFRYAKVFDTWQSLRIVKNFTKPHEFTLQVAVTNENIEYLKPRSCVLIQDVFYEIETVRGEDDVLMVSGQSMSRKLSEAINLFSMERTGKKPETIVYEILIKPRYLIPHFIKINKPIEFSAFNIRHQVSHQELLEILTTFCETYNFGYLEKAFNLQNPSTEIDIVPVKDLSDRVIFSITNENLLSENFEYSLKNFKDVAWVYGEGEGINRKMVKVDKATTYDRRTLYVDARDLQSEVEGGVFLSDAEYEAILYERGVQKLAEHAPIFSLSGTIDAKSKLFKLGVDYDVGDIVTIESEKFNIKTNLQITSIQETWDSTGYHIDPIFGKESPTIFEKLRR